MHIGGAVLSMDSKYTSNDDKFLNNYAPTGAAIYSEWSEIRISNGLFKSNKTAPLGLIYASVIQNFTSTIQHLQILHQNMQLQYTSIREMSI